MIPRYSQGQISKIWTDKNRYEIWFQIEVLVCEKLYIDKKISKKDFLQIKKKGKVDVEDIQKLDRKTHHEVIAFLNSISKKIGKSARHIHQGITSSDIIDTAFSIQLKQSSEILVKDITQLLKALKTKGLIKIHNFGKNENKLNYIYLLTPKGIAEKTKLTMNFMRRKMKEYDELKKELGK